MESANNSDIQRLLDRIRRLDALNDKANEEDEREKNDTPSIPTNAPDQDSRPSPEIPPDWSQKCIANGIQDPAVLMRSINFDSPSLHHDLEGLFPTSSTPISLPPRDETHHLLWTYLQHFNPIYPVFLEKDLSDLIDHMYRAHPTFDAASRACVYAVIAISYKLQLWSTSATDRVVASAWSYFNNASNLVPEISIAEPTLRSVQALTVMSIFLQGSMHFNNASRILGTAIRQAYSIDKDYDSDQKVHRDEYSNVRTVLYILDIEFSLHSGLPPMMKLDDLIGGQDDEKTGIPSIPDSTEGGTNLLPLFFSLSKIEEEIYQGLHSTRAQQESAEELLDTAMELDTKLEAWRNKLPFEIKTHIGSNCNNIRPTFQHLLLHLMYNNCLMTVHRLPGIHCPYTGLLSRYNDRSSPIFHRIQCCSHKRAEAAWSSIYAVQQLSTEDPMPFWLIPSYLIASIILLFTTIIIASDTSPSEENITAIDSAVSFIQSVNQRSHGEFTQMLNIATGTAHIARTISKKSEQDARARNVAQLALGNAVKELRLGLKKGKRKRPKTQDTRSSTRQRIMPVDDTSQEQFWWSRGSSSSSDDGSGASGQESLGNVPVSNLPQVSLPTDEQNIWEKPGFGDDPGNLLPQIDINWADFICDVCP